MENIKTSYENKALLHCNNTSLLHKPLSQWDSHLAFLDISILVIERAIIFPQGKLSYYFTSEY